MVGKNRPLTKHAFTMIELIFAVVIIAIVVMSLPMVTQVTNKNIENSLVQEALFASSAELIDATAGYWDEHSMSDINVSHLSRVIDVNNLCNNDTNSSRYRLRNGHIEQPYHRRCIDSNTTGIHDSNTSVVGIDVYDLNDASHGIKELFVDYVGIPEADAAGYKTLYRSELNVTLATDQNIKVITSTVYDNTGSNIVSVLRTQSANIGEIDFYKRRF